MKLSVQNHHVELAEVHEWLRNMANDHGIAREAVWKMGLALEELLTNVARYAWEDAGSHEIDFELTWTDNQIEAKMEDDGRAFDPLAHPLPDTSVPIDEKPVGGLGIHMARQTMDEIRYSRRNGHNVLLLRKRSAA